MSIQESLMTDARIEGRLYRIAFLVFEPPTMSGPVIETLSTTKQLQVVDWKNLQRGSIRSRWEGFHSSRGLSHISKMSIHLARITIISSPDSAPELPKLTGIKDQAIDLIESKQTLYDPIYSLGPVELETLKTYIKIWPIRPSKSPVGPPILFL